MLDEDARFLEGTGVEEELDPLARGEPAFGVELLDPLLAATEQGFLLAPPQLFDGVSGSQVRGLLARLRGWGKRTHPIGSGPPAQCVGSSDGRAGMYNAFGSRPPKKCAHTLS